MLDGTERIGVLCAPVGDADTAAGLRALASLAALLIVSKRPHSDTHAELVRDRPMSLPSEVIWPLMPPLTFATKDVAVTAVLEPAYEIGGDAVDYAMSPDLLHLSVFDAMGHDQSAGLTVAVATGACRNTRRRGARLPEIGDAIDEAIARQFDRKRFATGVLAKMQPSTGLLTWVNRGHPPPLLIRQGRWLTTRAPPRRRWASPWVLPRPSAATSWSRATACCSTPTASPRRGTRWAASSGCSGSPTWSPVAPPTAIRRRRRCGG